MTACVNKKHTRRVALAISASLVGALSLGVAPVAAVADDSITTLVGSQETAFSRGEIVLSGTGVTREDRNVYSATANANGTALDVAVDSVTPLGTYAADLDECEINIYKADEDGNKTGSPVQAVVEPGKYVVEVSAVTGQYAGGVVTAELNVKGASLEDLDYYEVNPSNPTAAGDQSLTYTGSAIQVGFQAQHVPYEEGVDYSVKILKKGTDNVSTAPGVDVVEAGDYVAYVTGLGQYAGETAEIPFTVTKFDFASATIEVADVIDSDTAPTHPTKVYVGEDDTYTELEPELVDLTFKSSGTSSSLFDKIGAYTFTASVDKTNENIGNNADREVTVNKVASSATFQVNGAVVEDSYLIDLSQASSLITSADKFNWDAIDVFNGDEELVKGSDYKITVTDASGKPGQYGNLEDLLPGTYIVNVDVDASATNYEVGGSASFTVRVIAGTVDADANAYVYLSSSSEDVVLTSYQKNYDGQAVYPGTFTVKLFDDDGKEISDLTLSWKLYDSEGNDVSTTGALRAGEYTLRITSTNYLLEGTTEMPVTINKIDLTTVKVGALQDWYGASYLPIDPSDTNGYTWEEFDLRYDTHIDDADDDDAYNDGAAWERLSTLPDAIQGDSYLQCQYWDEDAQEWVDVDWGERAVAEGQYRIVLTGNRDLALNYEFANDDYTTVVDTFYAVDMNRLVFRDVKPGDWHFTSTTDAYRQGYIKGIYGTDYYRPDSDISRADAAIIVARMAGVDGGFWTGDKLSENGLHYAQIAAEAFSDVEVTDYYAAVIGWAYDAGVIHGDTGADTFRPSDEISREEFAAILANYAALNGEDISVDADEALSDANGADTVSSWARDAVAWAYENGVMGNNGASLNGQGNITRAQTAAMAVNYQPEAL